MRHIDANRAQSDGAVGSCMHAGSRVNLWPARVELIALSPVRAVLRYVVASNFHLGKKVCEGLEERLAEIVDKVGLEMREIRIIAVHEWRHLEAKLLFLVALTKEFLLNCVRPSRRQLGRTRDVRYVRRVKKHLDKHAAIVLGLLLSLAVLLCVLVERGLRQPPQPRRKHVDHAEVVAHVRRQNARNHFRAHIVVLVGLELGKHIASGLLRNAEEVRCVVILENRYVVIEECQVRPCRNLVRVIQSRMLPVVTKCGNEEHKNVLKVEVLVCVAVDENEKHHLCNVKGMQVVVVWIRRLVAHADLLEEVPEHNDIHVIPLQHAKVHKHKHGEIHHFLHRRLPDIKVPPLESPQKLIHAIGIKHIHTDGAIDMLGASRARIRNIATKLVLQPL
eukprot:Opistho-2@29585